MRNVLFSKNFAIMTAENPMHPVSMQGGNAALENEFNKKGFKFHRIKGKYGGNPENSYLIENSDHNAIIDLGKKFGQDSVIVSKDGQHKMVYTNGPDIGKHYLGNSIETFENPPEDYYSTGVDNGKPFHFSINFDMNTKHQDDLQKSQPPKYLVHFSTTPNLKDLDPMMQGSAGRHSPETKYGRPEHPRVYFYEENTPTESVVTSRANAKYVVKHPDYDKIYDMGKDPHSLIQQAKDAWHQRPTGSLNDAFFKLLKDKGYLGYKNSASALPNVVALFHKTPVHAEIPKPLDMSADKTWTEASVPMSLKKSSDVKQAVKEIKGPAKVNEVLADAPADMRSKILNALRKEKLEKMNGAGVSGGGGATPPMMQPPVPAAPAMTGLTKADESESKMAKKDLKDIMEYAHALDGMVVETEDLEDWVDSKIAVARQYLSDIAHYLSYEHGQPTEELDKGDVISMKDKKVISTDTKPAPKTLVTKQPKKASALRANVKEMQGRFPKGAAHWRGPQPRLIKTEELDKGDVISMKDKKVISTDTKPAPKELVAQQPKMPKVKRPPVLIQTVKMAKSDSKKAKFERCVMAVKKKSGKDVNPWAVCHASVDGKMEKANPIKQPYYPEDKKTYPAPTKKDVKPEISKPTDSKKTLEKAEMSVKAQEKPTKGMPQAKQLKADADLEKVKEGAENVAKATDKKKSELNKSTGYFKQNPKTQLPEWHDPLKQQREDAAREEREVRPEEKAHIWAMLEREHQMSQKPKAQKPKEELEKKFSLKGALAAGAIGASALSGGAQASPESDLHAKLSNLNVMGEYHTPKTGSQTILKEPTQLKANPSHPHATYSQESKDGASTARFHGPDAEKAKQIFQQYSTVKKSEELENLTPDDLLNKEVSSSEVEDHVRDTHGRQDDFEDGDLIDRIHSAKTYKLHSAYPINNIEHEEFHTDDDHVQHYKESSSIEPIVVHKYKDGTHSIVDGAHRVRALKEKGVKTIPAYVGNLQKSEDLEKAKAKPPVGTPERKEFDTFVQQVKGRDKEKAEAAAKKLKDDYEYHENEILRLKKPTKKQKEIAKQVTERRAKALPGRNYNRQRDAVFGKWGSQNEEQKAKAMKAFIKYAKRKYNVNVEQVAYDPEKGLGKKNKQGKLINKPSFRNDGPVGTTQHIGNTDSAFHELGHFHQFGYDIGTITPDVAKINEPLKEKKQKNKRKKQNSKNKESSENLSSKELPSPPPKKQYEPKEQTMSEWQKDMDAHWGVAGKRYGFKKQARLAEEYEPTALENYHRRRAGLPPHQKQAAPEELTRLAAEKKGWKYKPSAVPRTHALDDPSKSIVQIIKKKGKDGKEKEIWLTGTSKNIRPETKEREDQIDRGELVLDPERGFVRGDKVKMNPDAKINIRAKQAAKDKTRKDANTLMRDGKFAPVPSPDAKINIRAREAAKDKSRKDADTLMRSEELQKKLIIGEGKPSKATVKATPEKHKEIMDKLSAALDTVQIDQSPEAAEERKMLLERVKRKLKGPK